jgi:hypothetical protein
LRAGSTGRPRLRRWTRETLLWDERQLVSPILVVNPAEDDVFGAFAQVIVDDGVANIGELERRLRPMYSKAVVHARELSSEPLVIWYVYRDGHWIDSPGSRQMGARRSDVRFTP